MRADPSEALPRGLPFSGLLFRAFFCSACSGLEVAAVKGFALFGSCVFVWGFRGLFLLRTALWGLLRLLHLDGIAFLEGLVPLVLHQNDRLLFGTLALIAPASPRVPGGRIFFLLLLRISVSDGCPCLLAQS